MIETREVTADKDILDLLEEISQANVEDFDKVCDAPELEEGYTQIGVMDDYAKKLYVVRDKYNSMFKAAESSTDIQRTGNYHRLCGTLFWCYINGLVDGWDKPLAINKGGTISSRELTREEELLCQLAQLATELNEIK